MIYYVDVPEDVARARWQDFEHGLNAPGAGIEVEFRPATGDASRTRLSMRTSGTGDMARMDETARRFRLFLEGRGRIDLTSGLRR